MDFTFGLAVRLQSSGRPFLGHFRDGIPNIDLAASDVVFAAIQRDAFGKTRYGVFSGGVWRGMGTGHMSRKRAIVDNAPFSRLLHLHQADCLLSTKERSSKIHAHDSRPLVVRVQPYLLLPRARRAFRRTLNLFTQQLDFT